MLIDENNLPDEEEVIDRVKADILHYGIESFSRAIPSSADGLKPVARRILYVLWENNIKGLVKVSKLGGMTMSYHVHGDKSITDVIVKMSQDGITVNHSLLSPEGSFGSISDLNAASPRYISTKVSNFGYDCVISLMDSNAMEMIEAESDFGEKEPLYLPSKIPIVLLNGTMGIAESYVTNIPQHNLIEIANLVIKFIKNKDVTAYELSSGLYPDYVVGGTIVNGDDVRSNYYNKSAGSVIKVRGDVEIDLPNNRILVRSMPLSYDFDSFIDKVKTILNDKDSNGNPKNLVLANISYIGEAKDSKVTDPYIYITCKNGSNLVEILDNLYKYTNLENSNKIDLTFYHNSKIKESNIKDIIKDWYDANYILRRRKIIHTINNLENRAHVLEGLYKVYDVIDEVIEIIRKSNDSKEDVVIKLKNKFGLSLIQARGIYEMQIGNLTKRSKSDLMDTINKVKENIKKNGEDLLNIDGIMINDLEELKRKYGRPRRTKIISKLEDRGDLVVSNGSILATRNNIGIFDSSNIISGKSILNGFKGVKIDNVWVKEIVNSHRIDDNIKSIAVFYENGTVNSITPTNLNCWINNKQCEENGFITAICPIYNNLIGTILCISDDGYIKRFDPESITTRASCSGITVKNCIYIPNKNEDDSILMVNKSGNYSYIKIKDVPILGKSAKGVMSNFESGKGVHITVVDDKNSHIVVLMSNETINSGFVYTVDKNDLKLMNRTNKLKKLYNFDNFNCSGISVIDMNIKDQIGLFISDKSTMSLKISNLKNLKEPRKISCIAFDFIPIQIN